MSSYSTYLANRTVCCNNTQSQSSNELNVMIQNEVYDATMTVFNQMQRLVSTASMLASKAAVSANEATTSVTEAASSATEAASSVSEIAAANEAMLIQIQQINQELNDKIEYLFMMFYHSDSNTIMENYPLS